MPVVMQPRLMVMILPLKPNRIGQSFTLRPFRALLLHLTPSLVLRAPGDAPFVVSQLLGRAQMVALIPRQYIQGLCSRLVVPQRIIIQVIGAFVSRLGQQAYRLVSREQQNQMAQMAQAGPAMAASAKDLAQAKQAGLNLPGL